MDCKSIMAPIKTSLYTDELAATAITHMVKEHMGLIPVIERDGKFAGLMSGDGLVDHLLPKTVRSVVAPKNIRYLNETSAELQGRLESVRQQTIGELIDRKVATATPNTPVIDALMLIKNKQYIVPVVDDDKKLLGVISFFSVLNALDAFAASEKTSAKARAAR